MAFSGPVPQVRSLVKPSPAPTPQWLRRMRESVLWEVRQYWPSTDIFRVLAYLAVLLNGERLSLGSPLCHLLLVWNLDSFPSKIWNWSLYTEDKKRLKKEAGHSRLADGRFNKQENLVARLVLGSHRTSRSIRNNVRMSTLTTTIQHSTEVSSQCNKAIKGDKRHTFWKERNKTAPISRWHDGIPRKSQEIHQKKS